jgi:O-antigen/teichoic acid export membrane protein
MLEHSVQNADIKKIMSPSALERAAVKILTYVPGMRRLAASRQLPTALRGSVWTIVGYGASQLLRLATTLVLARQLLSPEAFGLVALVTVFLSGLDMLSDLGIGMDVVQHRRGDEPAFLNTAFWIQVSRGGVVCLIAIALAYPFGYFYHRPEVCSMAIVGALSVAVRGLASGSVWLMARHVQLGKLAALNVSSEAAGFLVSVIWAIFAPNAWALIGGRLAAAIAYTVGSHLIAENRISMLWDRSAARDIFAFGAGIFVSTATYFLGSEAERLVIGKFISIEDLGCFSLALTLSAAPARAIHLLGGQVLFPILARSVRKDRGLATEHFRSARSVFLMLGTALAVFFIVFSHWLVMVLLPPTYAMTGWMLQFLGFRAGLEVFAGPVSSMLLASGASKYPGAANTVRMIVMVTGVWFAFSTFGVREAIGIVAIVAPLFVYPILIVGLVRHMPGALRFDLLCFGLFMAATGGAAFAVSLL